MRKILVPVITVVIVYITRIISLKINKPRIDNKNSNVQKNPWYHCFFF